MQADGLWLIGVGAFLLAAVGLAAAPLRLHLQFGGLGDRRSDRLAFAGTGVGLLSTATGSVLVAAGSSPAVAFVLATVATLIVVAWALLAWRVHSLWVARRGDAAMRLRYNQDLAREAWQLEAAALLARWRWAVCHPLTDTDANSWPYVYLRKQLGEEPAGVAEEWYSNDGLKLRQNRPSLVRVGPAKVPGWLRDIVAVAIDEGWIVLRAGKALVLYTPDGLSYETVECDEPGLAQGLVRHAVLRRLNRMGLPIHSGGRGQSLPGRDREQVMGALRNGSANDVLAGDG
jgi:hypothetical protein